MFGLFKKKKKTRGSLLVPQTFDAEAYKTEQPFVYEHPDVGWTTSDYTVPKDFLQFYYGCFDKQANSMLEAVDEDTPHYMDQHIVNAADEAVAFLIHKHSAHAESINEITSRKKVTFNCLERELQELNAEEERINAMIEEIGGYDYV